MQQKTCYENAVHYRAAVVNGSETLLPLLVAAEAGQKPLISSVQQVINDADSVY
jgi:hypothetical protein